MRSTNLPVVAPNQGTFLWAIVPKTKVRLRATRKYCIVASAAMVG